MEDRENRPAALTFEADFLRAVFDVKVHRDRAKKSQQGHGESDTDKLQGEGIPSATATRSSTGGKRKRGTLDDGQDVTAEGSDSDWVIAKLPSILAELEIEPIDKEIDRRYDIQLCSHSSGFTARCEFICCRTMLLSSLTFPPSLSL